MPSITLWRAEIDGKKFSGMIEIDGSFWAILLKAQKRYRVKVYCYVLMENHFHLVVMTPEGNLSQWMHQLKTAYTVYFNRRHQVVGHLFQGRFKSTVIEAEKYLLEVSRYLHLNPVRGKVLFTPLWLNSRVMGEGNNLEHEITGRIIGLACGAWETISGP